MKRNCLAALLLCLYYFSYSQNVFPTAKPETAGVSSERLARIDKIMNDHVTKGEIPGIVALIIRDGKIVYEKSFGYSDIENKTPLKADHIFRIASQSKAIASLAVMMLWEEGKFL